MRTRSLLIAAAVAMIARPQKAHAQLGPPPVNPIFTSVTGPDSEPSIFRSVSLSTFELLSASVQFSEKDNKQKVLFSPFKLSSKKYYPVLSETVLNFARDGDASTFGVGVSWTNTQPGGAKATKILNDPTSEYSRLLSTSPAERLGKDEGESDDHFKAYQDNYRRTVIAPLHDAFWRALAATNALRLSAGLNVQTFGLVGGTKVDVNEDGKIDNKYLMRAYDLATGVIYANSQASGVNASYHIGRKRAAAIEGTSLVSYQGFSVSAARRLKLLDENYVSSETYLKDLFIPAILLGGAIEYQRCSADSAADCERSLRSQLAFTPFLDVKFSKEAQFRLLFPIVRAVAVGKETKTELAPAVQFGIQLAGLK